MDDWQLVEEKQQVHIFWMIIQLYNVDEKA